MIFAKVEEVHATLTNFHVEHLSPDAFCFVDMVSGFLKGDAIRRGDKGSYEEHEQRGQGCIPAKRSISRCWTSSSRRDESVRPHTCRDGLRILFCHALILETEVRVVCDAAGKIRRKFQNETGADRNARRFSITQSPDRPIVNPRTVPTSRRLREKWGTRIASRGGALLERLHGCGFVVFHVEYGIELGDLQQIVDFLGELEQLQFAALVLGGGEGANQFADT